MAFTWSTLRKGDMVTKVHIDELRNAVDTISNTMCTSNYSTYNYHDKEFAYSPFYISDNDAEYVLEYTGEKSAEDNTANSIVDGTDYLGNFTSVDNQDEISDDGSYNSLVYSGECTNDLWSDNTTVYVTNDGNDNGSYCSSVYASDDIEYYSIDKGDRVSVYASVDNDDNGTYYGTEKINADNDDDGTDKGTVDFSALALADNDDHATYNGTYYYPDG